MITRYGRHTLCAILAIIAVAAMSCGVMQSRAEYSGGLVFVGVPKGIFGANYVRMFMWKPDDYADSLPSLTVHFEDGPVSLSDLSPDRVTTLGGQLPEGSIADGAGYILHYRFKNGRMTFFSVIPATGTAPQPSAFRFSTGGGPPFTLPIAHADLVRAMGEPVTSGRTLAN
jgi:hypothetical protein